MKNNSHECPLKLRLRALGLFQKDLAPLLGYSPERFCRALAKGFKHIEAVILALEMMDERQRGDFIYALKDSKRKPCLL